MMTHYYLVGKKSPVWDELRAAKKHQEEQHKEQKAVQKALIQERSDGLEEVLIECNGFIVGIKVQAKKRKKDEPYRQVSWDERKLTRPGWRYDVKDGFNKPALKTPEGKEIAKLLKTVRGDWSHRNMSERLFKHGFVVDGRRMYFATFAWNGKEGSPALVQMAACIKKKVGDAKLKEMKLTEVTASKAEKLLGEKLASDTDAA